MTPAGIAALQRENKVRREVEIKLKSENQMLKEKIHELSMKNEIAACALRNAKWGRDNYRRQLELLTKMKW